MLACPCLPTCPTCRTVLEGDAQFCPRDGSPLVAQSPTDPLVGRVLGGRYRLEGRLGQGGMGTVYKAHHTLMDKPVAVKVLRGDLAGDHEAVARFHREARSASRLDHEHVIRVTDFGVSDDGLLFLVMELLDGESLGALVGRGALEPRRAATLAQAIAQALAHAHEQGVVHRDLKPDNVFLARRGNRSVVKVLDFGLAKIGSELGAGPSITKAGVVFGTPEYMAPEQAEGLAIDARSDLYSLGVILYQMLVGELPFRAPSFLALLSKHVEEVPEPPRVRAPERGIPEELEAVVLKLLEKSPAARYQSAAELVDALGPFADAPPPSGMVSLETPVAAAGATPSSASVPPVEAASPSVMSGEVVERPPRRFGRGIALGLGALALAGGAVAAVVGILNNGKDKPPTTAVAAPAPAPAPSPQDALAQARERLYAGDLDAAEKILKSERQRRDSAELQILLGDLAVDQMNPLGALAHYHRATLLAPEQAEAHARLAHHLAMTNQREAACKEARLALARDGKNAIARAAAAAAHCK